MGGQAGFRVGVRNGAKFRKVEFYHVLDPFFWIKFLLPKQGFSFNNFGNPQWAYVSKSTFLPKVKLPTATAYRQLIILGLLDWYMNYTGNSIFGSFGHGY